MRGHSCGCREFAPQGKACYPSNALPAGREKGRAPRGRRTAVRAGFRVFATTRAIRLFRLLAKESRGLGRWILKEETVGFFLKWRSFRPFLSPWTERDIKSS